MAFIGAQARLKQHETMAVDENPYWSRTPQQATKDRINQLAEILDEFNEPITVRALTYKAHPEAHGDELSTKYQEVVSDCARGRTQGFIPWGSLKEERTGYSDPRGGYDTVNEFLDATLKADRIARQWSRDKTRAHKREVECWFEKATVKGDFKQVCTPYQIHQVSTRGQVTWTTKKKASDRLSEDAVIVYFGDNDEKGREIPDVLERDLGYLTNGNAPDVIWGGITKEHEQKYGMPSGSRLDAFEPQDLRDIIRGNIKEFIDIEQLERILEREEEQREEIRDRVNEMLS
jgi:hypothetical protein